MNHPRRFIFVVFIILLIIFRGDGVCGTSKLNAHFRILVSEVERPLKLVQKGYIYTIERIQDKGINKWCFEDEVIRILWTPDIEMKGMLFELRNKSDFTMKLVWDRSSFVDIEGKSHRVTHRGVRLIDRNTSQPPTIIISKSYLEDGFFPTDFIYFDSQWKSFPIIGRFAARTNKEAELILKTYYPGKIFKFLLPLEIQEELYEYIFVFKIYDVEIIK